MLSASAPLAPDAVAAVLTLTALSAVFAVKHVAADFLLQTNAMARGKERPRGWLWPLAAHAGCHAALTLAIVLVVAPRLWWLALVDFGVHGVVDRGKSAIAHRAQWPIDRPQFWWLLGFDQALHQLTNLALAAAILLL